MVEHSWTQQKYVKFEMREKIRIRHIIGAMVSSKTIWFTMWTTECNTTVLHVFLKQDAYNSKHAVVAILIRISIVIVRQQIWFCLHVVDYDVFNAVTKQTQQSCVVGFPKTVRSSLLIMLAAFMHGANYEFKRLRYHVLHNMQRCCRTQRIWFFVDVRRHCIKKDSPNRYVQWKTGIYYVYVYMVWIRKGDRTHLYVSVVLVSIMLQFHNTRAWKQYWL